MNNVVKGLLIFAAGAAAGTGVTYFVLKDKFQQKYEESVDEMRDMINARAKAKHLEDEITGDTLTEEGRQQMIERYTGYLEQLGYAMPEDEEEVSGVNPPDDDTGIEEITSEEFTDGYTGYSSMTLTYYAGDGTWIGPEETVLAEDDVCLFVGNDLYDKIEGIREHVTLETDSLYICNHEQACLYEVMFLPGKFMNAE